MLKDWLIQSNQSLVLGYSLLIASVWFLSSFCFFFDSLNLLTIIPGTNQITVINEKIKIGVSIKVKNGDILDIKKCIDGNRAYIGFSGEMKLKKSI